MNINYNVTHTLFSSQSFWKMAFWNWCKLSWHCKWELGRIEYSKRDWIIEDRVLMPFWNVTNESVGRKIKLDNQMTPIPLLVYPYWAFTTIDYIANWKHQDHQCLHSDCRTVATMYRPFIFASGPMISTARCASKLLKSHQWDLPYTLACLRIVKVWDLVFKAPLLLPPCEVCILEAHKYLKCTLGCFGALLVLVRVERTLQVSEYRLADFKWFITCFIKFKKRLIKLVLRWSIGRAGRCDGSWSCHWSGDKHYDGGWHWFRRWFRHWFWYWFVHCLDDLFDHWFDHFIVVPQMVRHSGVYAIIAWMLWHAPGHLCPRVSMPSSTQVMVLRSHLINNTWR